MNNQQKIKNCIDVLREFGFEGEGFQFFKEGCHIMFMGGDVIRMCYNTPGIGHVFIGPPLPDKEQLRNFLSTY